MVDCGAGGGHKAVEPGERRANVLRSVSCGGFSLSIE
jgi:hypothetical protein